MKTAFFTFTKDIFFYIIIYMLVIKKIDEGSLGEELELNIGDKILSFDGYEAEDLLDYLYYDEQESFLMEVETGGEIIEFEVEKETDETLGLSFESDNLSIKTCRNDCVFCFVAQMPKGMRKTLYVKDDDYRQSFLCGNYVTLTNVSDKDIERIIRLRLSPLYISVHVTDGEIRKKMLKNRFADRIMSQLAALDGGGIVMNTQIVLVKGMNDGQVLINTLKDLSGFKNVKTCAVVPCGITRYREGLVKIEDYDQASSRSVIELVKDFNRSIGRDFALVADDFYLKAHMPCESYEYYGEFDQIENGIGMNAMFDHEFTKSLEKRTYRKTFLIVTGVASKDFIAERAKITESYCEGLKVYVEGIENKFFGSTVTCTGLIVGRDVYDFVKDYDKPFDELVISGAMLNVEKTMFLDDMTVKELSDKLGKKIRVLACDGAGFFKGLTSDDTGDNQDE